MIADLKPYPEYKDSGLPWLGSVPGHWNLPRLGSVLRERKETNEEKSVDQVLSVLKDIGVIRYEDKGRIGNKKSEDIGRYKIVRPDDIVVNCMNVIIGSVGRSRYTGCLSPVYYVLTRRSETDNPHYIAAIFSAKPFHESLVRIGNGILAHRMRIPMELLKCELFPLPPPEEQAAIVRFLDWANGRLEKAIRAKKKIIALLNEQKQAIIHRAVTRGLDPNVHLKDSGIPWLGQIPKHWEVRKLRHILSEVTERNRPDLPLLSVVREKGVIVRDVEDKEANHNFIPEDLSNYKVVRKDQFAMNKMKAWQGSYGVSPSDGIVSPAYFVFDTAGVEGGFFNIAIRSKAYVPFFTKASDGVRVGQWDLSQARMKEIPFLIPPVAEQPLIVEHIENRIEGIVSTIIRTEREIELLNEYRTRLVADVVTGKMDVRGAAKNLPSIGNEPAGDPLDDAALDDEDAALEEIEA